MPDDRLLEEQALSQAAELGISTQLEEVNKINVDVRTDLGKMVQGKADSIAISGQGMVVQKDIRVESMELQVNRINIDVLSAIFGEIKLTRPTDAMVRMVLTETDINRALTSDYIHSKLKPLELDVDGQLVTLELQQMQVRLPGSGKIECDGICSLGEMGKTREVGFSAAMRPRTHSHPILLERFNCTRGQGISLEIVASLIQKLKDLVNQPYFQMEETSFRVKDMEVEEGSMTVQAEAYLTQIPTL